MITAFSVKHCLTFIQTLKAQTSNLVIERAVHLGHPGASGDLLSPVGDQIILFLSYKLYAGNPASRSLEPLGSLQFFLEHSLA